MDILREFLTFMLTRRKFWLWPVMLILLLVGTLLALSYGSAIPITCCWHARAVIDSTPRWSGTTLWRSADYYRQRSAGRASSPINRPATGHF